MPNSRLNLTSQRFGALTAIEASGRNDRRGVVWCCLCDCGVERLVSATELNMCIVTHCGCLTGKNRNANSGVKLPPKNSQPIPAEPPKTLTLIDFYLRSYRHGIQD